MSAYIRTQQSGNILNIYTDEISIMRIRLIIKETYARIVVNYADSNLTWQTMESLPINIDA